MNSIGQLIHLPLCINRCIFSQRLVKAVFVCAFSGCIPTLEGISFMFKAFAFRHTRILSLFAIGILCTCKFLFSAFRGDIHEGNLSCRQLPVRIQNKTCRHLIVAFILLGMLGIGIPAHPFCAFHRCFRFVVCQIGGNIRIQLHLLCADLRSVIIIEGKRI